jgi:RNA-directed DNA polymerase
MYTKLDRLTELAKEDRKRQFYSIAHMITPEALYAAYRGLRKKASAGVDGVTYGMYERDAARNIQTLHERLKKGKYQAQPLRRFLSCSGDWNQNAPPRAGIHATTTRAVGYPSEGTSAAHLR